MGAWGARCTGAAIHAAILLLLMLLRNGVRGGCGLRLSVLSLRMWVMLLPLGLLVIRVLVGEDVVMGLHGRSSSAHAAGEGGRDWDARSLSVVKIASAHVYGSPKQ